MNTATLVIAVVGLTLSAASVAWQAATFRLTGARVKVRFHVGYAGHEGALLGPSSIYTEDGLEALRRGGYTQEIVAIEAINVGRLAATVRDWSIKFGNRAIVTSSAGFENAPLPHRLEPQTSETWYMHAAPLCHLQTSFTDQSTGAATARAAVELAGRTVYSRDALICRANRIDLPRPSRLARGLARIRRRPHG